ncbi:MAG: hypothetical protein Kow0080_16740 [Candidatus Promineifilaceae bacterium]
MTKQDSSHKSRVEKLDALRETAVETASAPEIKHSGLSQWQKKRLKQLGVVIGILVGITAVYALANWLWQQRPDPPPGAVTGLVLNLQGRPVADAVVQVEGHADIRTITDENGRYQLNNIPAGPQRITIQLANGASGTAYTPVIQSNTLTDLGTSRLFQP